MIVNGFCPTLDKDHSIEVDYINASTLDGKAYIRGLFTCSVVSFGGECPVANNCPVYNSAPKER